MIKTLTQLRTKNRSFFGTLFQYKYLDRLLTKPNGEKVLVRCKCRLVHDGIRSETVSWRTRWEIYDVCSDGSIGHFHAKHFAVLEDLKQYLKGKEVKDIYQDYVWDVFCYRHKENRQND